MIDTYSKGLSFYRMIIIRNRRKLRVVIIVLLTIYFSYGFIFHTSETKLTKSLSDVLKEKQLDVNGSATWVDNSKRIRFYDLFDNNVTNSEQVNSQGNGARNINSRKLFLQLFNHNQDVSFPFSYLTRNKGKCDENVNVINVVFTKTGDRAIRQLIRSLWGHPTIARITGVYVVFILGKSSKERENRQLLKEEDLYGDIVQLNFNDTYNNLAQKSLSMLHWVGHYCSGAKWVVKSDTDAFVDVFTLKRSLDFFESSENLDPSAILCGKVCVNVAPFRTEGPSKYRISIQNYPYKYYPPYCSGTAYVLPWSLIPHLYSAANKLSPFVFEDVYFTGIIPTMLEDVIPIRILEFESPQSLVAEKNHKTFEHLWTEAIARELSRS